jgi:predicted DNA-binding transcriptional regulator AlpA
MSDTFPARRLLQSKEADSYCGFAEGTLEKLRARKAGPPYVKYGHSVRYDLGHIDVWLHTLTYDPREQESLREIESLPPLTARGGGTPPRTKIDPGGGRAWLGPRLRPPLDEMTWTSDQLQHTADLAWSFQPQPPEGEGWVRDEGWSLAGRSCWRRRHHHPRPA